MQAFSLFNTSKIFITSWYLTKSFKEGALFFKVKLLKKQVSMLKEGPSF